MRDEVSALNANLWDFFMVFFYGGIISAGAPLVGLVGFL